jgi:hypothetical protein
LAFAGYAEPEPQAGKRLGGARGSGPARSLKKGTTMKLERVKAFRTGDPVTYCPVGERAQRDGAWDWVLVGDDGRVDPCPTGTFVRVTPRGKVLVRLGRRGLEVCVSPAQILDA